MELLFGIAVYRHRVQCAVEGRARPVGGPVGVGLGFGFGCTGSFPRHNARFPWITLRLERGQCVLCMEVVRLYFGGILLAGLFLSVELVDGFCISFNCRFRSLKGCIILLFKHNGCP